MFSLTHRVELRIPSECRCGEQLSPWRIAREQKRIVRMLVEYFGGAEVAEIKGFFKLATGRIAGEAVCVVSAYADEISHAKRAGLELLAGDIAAQLEQESIALVIDGEMAFHESGTRRAACAHIHASAEETADVR